MPIWSPVSAARRTVVPPQFSYLVLAAAILLAACALPTQPVSPAPTQPSAPKTDPGGAAGVPKQKTAVPSELAARMLAEVNRERAAHGLPALSLNARLSAAAKAHAEDMAANDFLAHFGSDGAGLEARLDRADYVYAAAAENLASGAATPKEAVRLWMGSPGHRQNILYPDFREAGFGRAVRPAGVTPGSRSVVYWALTFGLLFEDRYPGSVRPLR